MQKSFDIAQHVFKWVTPVDPERAISERAICNVRDQKVDVHGDVSTSILFLKLSSELCKQMFGLFYVDLSAMILDKNRHRFNELFQGFEIFSWQKIFQQRNRKVEQKILPFICFAWTRYGIKLIFG